MGGAFIRQAFDALNTGDVAAAEADVYLAKLPPERRTADMLVGFSPEGRSPPLAELRLELDRIMGGAVALGNNA